jgi:hypothetical protein
MTNEIYQYSVHMSIPPETDMEEFVSYLGRKFYGNAALPGNLFYKMGTRTGIPVVNISYIDNITYDMTTTTYKEIIDKYVEKIYRILEKFNPLPLYGLVEIGYVNNKKFTSYNTPKLRINKYE